MFPLLPFAAGIIAGGLAVRWLRGENTRTGLQKARETLHTATQSSLATIKSSTAAVKQRFAAAPAEIVTPDTGKPAAKAKAAPRKRKVSVAPVAPASAAAPASKAAPRKRSRKPAGKAQGAQE